MNPVETGFYYLQSRYYDAGTCRFLNADDTAVLGLSANSPIGANLFAYCGNNSVMRIDPTGQDWRTIIGGGISFILSFASWIPWWKTWMVWGTIVFTSAILAYSTYCWMKDLSDAKSLYKNHVISYCEYRRRVELCNMGYYITVAACAVTILTSALGLKFKKLANSAGMTLLSFLLGHTIGNVSWAFDMAYTIKYSVVMRRLGV